MSIHNFNGLRSVPIIVTGSGDTYNVKKNATVVVSSADMDAVAGILEKPGAKNNTYNIDGTVIGTQVGIYSQGKGAEINIGADGQVIGTYGVAVTGAHSTINNKGTIVASQANAIYALAADDLHVSNNGLVTGVSGMFIAGDAPVKMSAGAPAAAGLDAVLVNGAHGEIVAAYYGIAVASAVGDHTRIVNHGTIRATQGDELVIYTDEGIEKVVNDGKLVGNVNLGAGDDNFDNRGGKVTGIIVGNLGDDTLITDNAKVKLTEEVGEGTADTVRSTVSYTLSDNVERLFLLGSKDIDGTGTALDDVLHGNAGDNILKGKAGMDHLYGHKGNDKLIGGADVDYFHFKTGNGDDVISDFQDAIDQIDLSGWAAITSLADLKNNHAHNQGADVIIEAGTDSLLIKGIHKADLDLVDFFPF